MHLNLFSRLTSEPWAVMEGPLRDFYAQLRPVALGHQSVKVPEVTAKAGIIGPVSWDGTPMIPQLEVISGIGVIRVKGVLANNVGWIDAIFGAYDYAWLGEFLDQALSDRGVSTILLDINSPGGAHVGMEETSEVVAYAARLKPVISFTSGLLASAALRLAFESQYIGSTPSAIIGSIGSKLAAVDDSEAWRQAGYKLELFTSNGQGEPSPLKGLMQSGKPMTDVERNFLRDRTNECAAQFLSAVRAKRPQATGIAFDGGWVFGGRSVADGLTDGVFNSLEQFIATLLAA